MVHPVASNESQSAKLESGSSPEPTPTGFPQSLAFMPAGLEVVPGYEMEDHAVQSEKQAAQAEPEAIGADTDKEILHPWVPNPLSTSANHSLPKRRICGLNRTLFWLALTLLIFALALCIGLGAGLGVKRSQSDGQCDSGKASNI